jgi:LysM repeat protein
MKKQLNQLRRFFARTGAKKLNAATAREVIPASYDDDDDSNRLSGAFVVVLLLHVVALVGVFAFSRMKEPKLAKDAIAEKPAAISSPALAAATDAGDASAVAASVASIERTNRDPLPASASEPQRPVIPRANDNSYVVRTGDNLTRIAVGHGVTPAALKEANKLTSDAIKPGQELIIPEARKSTTKVEANVTSKPVEKPLGSRSSTGTYTVRKNDTLTKIARTVGVPYEELVKLNNIKDPKKLQAGQILKYSK